MSLGIISSPPCWPFISMLHQYSPESRPSMLLNLRRDLTRLPRVCCWMVTPVCVDSNLSVIHCVFLLDRDEDEDEEEDERSGCTTRWLCCCWTGRLRYQISLGIWLNCAAAVTLHSNLSSALMYGLQRSCSGGCSVYST